MRVAAAVALGIVLGTACEQVEEAPAPGRPTMRVERAFKLPGDCLLGSDGGFCHEVTVVIDNRAAEESFDPDPVYWHGVDWYGRVRRDPVFLRGAAGILPGDTGMVVLGFNATDAVLTVLRYNNRFGIRLSSDVPYARAGR